MTSKTRTDHPGSRVGLRGSLAQGSIEQQRKALKIPKHPLPFQPVPREAGVDGTVLMDPLSALSVAASVVTFVDFGGKLVSQFWEIRKSGDRQPQSVVALLESAKDLSSIATTARKGVRDLGSSYPRLSGSLARLDGECVGVETQLEALLEKMTSKLGDNKLKNLNSNAQAAVRAVMSEKEVGELRGKLDKIRSLIMMNVLMCLWDEAKNTRERTESIGGGVGYLTEVVHRIETTMNSLQDDFRKISAGGTFADDMGQARVANAIWVSSGLLDLPHNNQSRSSTPSNIPVDQATVSHRILQSLRFEEMDDRGERIAVPYPDTFKWLFQGKEFKQWLQSQNKDIFWITGKPASGKSTLMKFISSYPNLRENLQKWAGNSQLFLATFFFWGPGSKIQKSRVGLLRSLLYQLLSQEPDLCRVVTPRRQAFFEIAGVDAASPTWEWLELRECLLRFAARIKGKSRFALFIDGLDEYDGNHDELVSFIKQLHQEYNAKICVSSRPWNVFSDEFKHGPSLRMEDLTKSDIDVYIQERLGSNIAIQELRRLEPSNINTLMREIRERAEGVFLWVVLVVEQLLATVRDYPHLPAIWKTFNDLPRGLEELYETIQRTIGPDKQETASKLYQLVMEWKRTWNGQIEATFLWFAVGYVEPLQRASYPEIDKERLIKPLITRLLAGHTKGILQVSTNSPDSKSPTIDFLHRTAFDWLRTEENWSKICSQGPPEFQATITIIAALVSHLRSLGQPSEDSAGSEELRMQYIFRILKISGDVENTIENKVKILTILDQIESERLLPLDLEPMFLETDISASDRPVPHGLATLAAVWCSLPYLQAKCDACPQIPHIKPKSRFKLFSNEPRPISLLEASVLGGLSERDGRKSLCRFNTARGFTKWQTSQRLDTVRFLLSRDAKPDSYLKNFVTESAPDHDIIFRQNEDKSSFRAEYWFLVAKMFKLRSNLVLVDDMKRKLLPEAEKSRTKNEFPEFQINLQSLYHGGEYQVPRLLY